MNSFDLSILKNLYVPPPNSHKGQNGKLMIIGGSKLFHAASLWALKISSRIVDMVFYCSVPENNEIVMTAKEEFRDGIVVPRSHIEDYIKEADAVLIGPGMVRSEIVNSKYEIENKLEDINQLEDEGEQTYYLTNYLLNRYPEKKWVIDAGALQMMEREWLTKLQGNVIITPHQGEFRKLFDPVILGSEATPESDSGQARMTTTTVQKFAKEYNCVILLKGETDSISSPTQTVQVPGGNAGMTKGGTGDVLAGLVAALATKNDLWLAAQAGSFFNKKAGESLSQTAGLYFNASDLADEIPKVMKEYTG